ncbi:MAG: DUF1080 domain-containing protein [Planctomycetaceae bacterium]|jgi:hypothetical protein|nr:DUF1080 domain-containing protein [Planctomycetaceae bacterium]
MLCRLFFTAAVLFSASFAAAQGTGTKPPVLTGFTPLTEKELQAGFIRAFDGITPYGWGGKTEVKEGKLFFTGKTSETPYRFFFRAADENIPQNTGNGISADSAKLRLEEMKPIFDGKTLTGWKLHGKAEAAVADGTIRLTNGSGSLESEEKYGDFVLQLEYKTDKPVNSGVFFRCIPGELMNGYECQICNHPPEEDYKKFIGTDTGGIFRRQVGRNVGPKDGQWNYLTIAAKGNEIATWVNGIQVTDFKDDRKNDPNPRKGLRTEAGTIQFQGHDQTTEIFFRNIRIKAL